MFNSSIFHFIYYKNFLYSSNDFEFHKNMSDKSYLISISQTHIICFNYVKEILLKNNFQLNFKSKSD